jgi:hypothetical protein
MPKIEKNTTLNFPSAFLFYPDRNFSLSQIKRNVSIKYRKIISLTLRELHWANLWFLSVWAILGESRHKEVTSNSITGTEIFITSLSYLKNLYLVQLILRNSVIKYSC